MYNIEKREEKKRLDGCDFLSLLEPWALCFRPHDLKHAILTLQYTNPNPSPHTSMAILYRRKKEKKNNITYIYLYVNRVVAHNSIIQLCSNSTGFDVLCFFIKKYY